MKIGILTFHRAINYGAVLQCYALYTTLKNMGHDVEVIDYRPDSIEKYRMYFRHKELIQARSYKEKARYIMSCIALLNSKRKTRHAFNSFIDNYLNLSSIVKDAKGISDDYDVIFFGSDQIWSPKICDGLDKIYMGQFSKKNAKFFSYAASIGEIDMIKDKVAHTFENYIKVFDKISVREIQAQKFLSDSFSKESQLVCDPTILLTKKYYESLSRHSIEGNYVLLFSLIDDNEAYMFAKHIAKQLNIGVLSIKALLNPLKKKKHIRGNVPPQEFLGYIRNALCVVTNSFHATSLSIIFEKDFYTLKRKNNNDRAMTLLKEIGLTNRMVDLNEKVIYSPVNYNDVKYKLDNYRKKSLDFIEECIQ